MKLFSVLPIAATSASTPGLPLTAAGDACSPLTAAVEIVHDSLVRLGGPPQRNDQNRRVVCSLHRDGVLT